MSLRRFAPPGRVLIGRVLTCFLSAASAIATPVVTQQPQAIAPVAGQNATFSVTANGTGTLSYQWRRDGFTITGATGATLAIANVSQGDNGTYDVVVSDSQQAVASAGAVLRVSPRSLPDVIRLDSTRSVSLEGPDNGTLNGAVALADGRFYLSGTFTSVENQPRGGLARFLVDGSLDRSFSAPLLDGYVQAMAMQSDGKLIIGGSFKTVNGAQSVGLARLNLDGSLDASFAVGTGFSNPAPFFYIRAIAVGPDGSVYVSGNFGGGYKGVGVPPLIKLMPDASLAAFAAPSNLSDGPDSLLVTPEGKLYAGGVSYRNADSSSSAFTVARFLPTGAQDPAFPPLASDQFHPIFRLFRQTDGKLIVTGYFEKFGGVSRRGIARFSENGVVDTSFNVAVNPGDDIVSVASLPNGDLLLAGYFFTKVTRVTSTGSIVPSFTPPFYGRADYVQVLTNGQILVASGGLLLRPAQSRPGVDLLSSSGTRIGGVTTLRFPARAYVVRPVSGGKLIVAGEFTHWNGTPVSRIVRLNPDGALDASFRVGAGPDGVVITGTVQPDGKIILLGGFTAVSNISANGAVRLNVDGTVDTTFRANADFGWWYPSPPAVLRDGRIFLGTTLSGKSFFLWNADGSTAPPGTFGTGSGSTDYGQVSAVSRLPNGQLLVGGPFTTWNGQSKPHLVRLNPDGSVDSALTADPNLTTGYLAFDVTGNTAQSSGRAILGLSSAPYLQRIDGTGKFDPTFAPGLPHLSYVAGFLLQSDDRIITWGTVDPSPDLTTPYVARLNANGTLDSSFVVLDSANKPGTGSLFWSTALVTDAGELLASTPGLLARYAPVTTPVIVDQPASVTIAAGTSATWSVTAIGSGSLSYQWLFQGQPIPGATATTYSVPRVTPPLAGMYSVTVTNAFGSITSNAASLSVDTSANGTMRLSNVSVRARVSGAPLITGFTIGSGSKRLLMRAIGPTLGQFGVAGVLPDPTLSIYSGQTLVDRNDNWGGSPSLASAAAAVSAFPLPLNSTDAVLLRDIDGPHTAHTDGGASSGVVLSEIYDIAPIFGGAARLTNVSARYQVGTGENILIAGFTVTGSGLKALLVRGIGPGLEAFGVTGALSDPQLAVYAGNTRLAENNDWGGTAELFSAFGSVGAFRLPLASRDAALIVYLPAGSYTAQLSGVGNTTGEGLVEIYELP